MQAEKLHEKQFLMNVDQLKANLVQAICEGYEDSIVNFCDQDGDSITIDQVYLDDEMCAWSRMNTTTMILRFKNY